MSLGSRRFRGCLTIGAFLLISLTVVTHLAIMNGVKSSSELFPRNLPSIELAYKRSEQPEAISRAVGSIAADIPLLYDEKFAGDPSQAKLAYEEGIKRLRTLIPRSFGGVFSPYPFPANENQKSMADNPDFPKAMLPSGTLGSDQGVLEVPVRPSPPSLGSVRFGAALNVNGKLEEEGALI
ncbi:hypothetical protein BJ742DRAFT_484762 [Cladochytrium replicatum]|nr:hypothetical protein BJ742DRAFT_484762 [Cladochytrium replicatum]